MKKAALRYAGSGLSLAGGAAIAIFPPVILLTAGRLYSPESQGFFALAVTLALFAGQLSYALIVEARLSSPFSTREVGIPRWLLYLVLVAGLLVIVFPSSVELACVSIVLFQMGLEVGRGAGVANQQRSLEIWAALSLGLASGIAVLLSFTIHAWSLQTLAVGVIAATIIRYIGGHSRRLGVVSHGVRTWLGIDIAIVGGAFPALTGAILLSLGSQDAFLFAAISSVSGLIGIPLSYLRMRLLKSHSTEEILVSAAAVLLAIVAIAVAQFGGLFAIFFGDYWTIALTTPALFAACCWRVIPIWTVVPFATLRRLGSVRSITLVRAIGTVVTLTFAFISIQMANESAIFWAFCLGEILQGLGYRALLRRK